MDIWTTVAVVLIGAPVVWALGSIVGVLNGCYKELVRIRAAVESLHDRVLPEVFMQQWERARRR
jgi:hypothetical protein